MTLSEFGVIAVKERKMSIVWKVSKYGVIYGLYFPAFGLNTERYTFRAVESTAFLMNEVD